MKKLTKIMSLVLALCMLMLLSACGSKEAASASSGKKVYQAITNATYPPMDTVDEEGNIVGFDMDLLNAIAKDQGFEVEFVDMAFDALVPALEAGNGDIIASSMVSTEERKQHVDFVDYLEGGYIALLARDDNETIHSLDDLTPDMKAATQIASNFADMLQKKVDAGELGEVVLLDGFNECILQLQNGDVDVVMLSDNVALNFIESGVGNVKLKIVAEIPGPGVGFGIRKSDTELYKSIEEGLQHVKESGLYDELIAQWKVK